MDITITVTKKRAEHTAVATRGGQYLCSATTTRKSAAINMARQTAEKLVQANPSNPTVARRVPELVAMAEDFAQVTL